jgi:hypothetical protein
MEKERSDVAEKKRYGRSFDEELTYISRVSPHKYEIKPGM